MAQMPVDVGIDESARREAVDGLSRLLAETYTLYLQTHNFHWNVTGPMFQPLHDVFEEQYMDLAQAVDAIAERIRALGFPAPGTYREFGELSSIEEVSGVPSAQEMVSILVSGHEAVTRTARSMFESIERSRDEATVDLLTQRMRVHEKKAWMLRSFLT
jgi:starvation-inducible DNA-binding protein